MIKRNYLKSLVIGTLLLGFTGQLWAQKTVKKAVLDSVKITVLGTKLSTGVPGRLFNISENNFTGAVSSVKGDVLYGTPSPNLLTTLSGRLSGLTVSQVAGDPGNDYANLAIRGGGSNALGQYNGFKIYVDGFEVYSNYLSFISPSDIESVSILKDAASLAQFGMNGANGVIWVVTKQGQGKLKITFKTRTGTQQARNINKSLGSYDFANLYNQALCNDNGAVWNQSLVDSKGYSVAKLASYQDGTGINTDWYDQILKKNGSYSDGDLSFSGSDKSIKYYVGFNYGNQQGLFNVVNSDSTSNSQLTNYSLRANLTFKISKLFEGRVALYGRLDDRKSPNYSSGQLISDAQNYPSNIYPVFDNLTKTHYSGTSVFPNNPFASANAQGWSSSRNRFLQGNFGLKEDLSFITPGLYLDQSVSQIAYSRVAYSKTRSYARYINGTTTTTTQTTPLAASSMAASGQDDWKQLKLLIGYDRIFGSHHIQSALEYHISTEIGEGNFGYQTNSENYNGRLNYSFKNKYVGEFGFSYFGCDAYKPGNQWAFYPTVSGAWIVSNESFLQGNPIINYLKFRASAGESGNSGSSAGNGISNYNTGGRYLYEQYYVSSGSFSTGGATQSSTGGLVKLFTANPEISPEKSLKYNVGLDFTLFKKLTVGVDAFMDKRSNIPVADNTIPSLYGNNFKVVNLGTMTFKGIDADLNFSDKIGDFNYNLTSMISFNQNTLDYFAEVPTSFAYNASTGRPYGTQIGLVAEGLYQLEDFNADGTLKSGLAVPSFGKVQPGDIKYTNLNPGTGVGEDNVIDQSDITAIGKSSLPDFTYSFGASFNYKAFDFSVFFQGVRGGEVNILSTANSQVEAFTNNSNAFPIAKGAWAYYPDQFIDTRATATYPRLTTVTNSNNYRASSFWIKSNDYLRIRNVELGYTVDSKLISKVGLSKFRIYVNTTNPLTWSSLLKDYNMDPESFSGYPTLKSFNVGLSATF